MNTDLIEVPVEDGIGEGAEEAGDVTQAEPGPEQGVISIGVGSRADTHNIHIIIQFHILLFLHRFVLGHEFILKIFCNICEAFR